MNVSGGMRALGQGLQLIADRQFQREEREWMAAREENLMRLRHGQNLELEGMRADNDRQAADAQRRFVAGENARDRRDAGQRQDRADARADARAERADNRADARQRRGEARDDARELSELRRHRTTTLQNFRAQYGKALQDFNEAKASGMTDPEDLAELQANVSYIAQEMQDFDAQSKDALAQAGDPWAKSQLLSDDDFEPGGAPAAIPGAGAPSAATPGQGAATPKAKPMQSSVAAEQRPLRPNPVTGNLRTIADWAGEADIAAAKVREEQERQARQSRPRTAAQLSSMTHGTSPRLIP